MDRRQLKTQIPWLRAFEGGAVIVCGRPAWVYGGVHLTSDCYWRRIDRTKRYALVHGLAAQQNRETLDVPQGANGRSP